MRGAASIAGFAPPHSPALRALGLYWTSTSGHSTGFDSAHVEEPVSRVVQTEAHAGAFIAVILLPGARGTAFAMLGAMVAHVRRLPPPLPLIRA